MLTHRPARLVLLSIMLLLVGCASLGDTPADKRQAVIEMRDQTLARLYREKPGARKRIAEAAGKQSIDMDVTTYQMMESGIALQATVGASKYWKWRELNQ